MPYTGWPARVAASAARSAAVTGSNRPERPLSSMLSVVRKKGRIASPAAFARRSTKALKSMAVMRFVSLAIAAERRALVYVASLHRERVLDADREFPMKTFRLSLLTVVSVGILCALYMMSQFLRNSVGVIAPDIAANIRLTAADLGFLSSVY